MSAQGGASEYDQLVGQTLDGRYHVLRKIGEGSTGVVFAARHAVIERPLAIKVLKREVMRDATTARRFVREAKAASRIGHPSIVDVTDFGTTPDGMTYSVMEYIAGQTLGAALRAGAPFALPRAVRIAAQLARALDAAHELGIVHRDLKPENVFLVDREGRPDFVKIVDFGIAKVAPVGEPVGEPPPGEPHLTRAGAVLGTPEYMAPEQATGRADADRRVDVYALGVILYEMTTGRVPHKGDTMVRTLAMQILDPATPPSQMRPDLAIGAELDALILKALAKPREQRFQTMGELIEALERLQLQPPAPRIQPAPVAGEPSLPLVIPAPITAQHEPGGQGAFPRMPTGPASGHRRGPLLAALGLLLAAAAGVITFLTTRSDHRADGAPADARGTVVIEVLTQPAGANLYVGAEYRGSGGARLEEPLGTRLEVTCRRAGYKPGTVQLVFDGTRAATRCVLERDARCVPGLKNPFHDCPDGAPADAQQAH